MMNRMLVWWILHDETDLAQKICHAIEIVVLSAICGSWRRIVAAGEYVKHVLDIKKHRQKK